jgi:hypothetical protein
LLNIFVSFCLESQLNHSTRTVLIWDRNEANLQRQGTNFISGSGSTTTASRVSTSRQTRNNQVYCLGVVQWTVAITTEQIRICYRSGKITTTNTSTELVPKYPNRHTRTRPPSIRRGSSNYNLVESRRLWSYLSNKYRSATVFEVLELRGCHFFVWIVTRSQMSLSRVVFCRESIRATAFGDGVVIWKKCFMWMGRFWWV